jgi:hypothetical protein
MSGRDNTNKLVEEVASALRPAAADDVRQAENVEFAKAFIAKHAETFERLSK